MRTAINSQSWPQFLQILEDTLPGLTGQTGGTPIALLGGMTATNPISISGVWSRLRRTGQPDSQTPPADTQPDTVNDTTSAGALAPESGEPQTHVEDPPQPVAPPPEPVTDPPHPEIDEWLGNLERDLGNTPARTARWQANAHGQEPVTHAPDAPGAVAPHQAATEQPVAGKRGAPMDRWWEQGDSDLTQKTHGLEKQLYGLLTRAAELEQKQSWLESLQDRLHQVEALSTRTGAQFDALRKSRADLEKFRAEIQAFHASRAEITQTAWKLAADRTAFEGFVQRVDDFQRHIPGLDSKIEAVTKTLSQKTAAVSVLGQQTDGLEARVDTLQQKQTGLESLQDRLSQIDELSTHTAARFDTLQKSRAELETFHEEIRAARTSRDEVARTAEKLAAQQTVFERFVARVEEFQQRLPELESKMDAITATAAVVAAQTQMVAAGTQQVVTLVAMADDLNLQVTRIEGHRQAVESIEARLNTLKTLSDTVDRKLKEQLGGRTGVDGKLLKELSSQIAATDR